MPNDPIPNMLSQLIKDSNILAASQLDRFNQKKLRLKELPSHKRIFLFFLTRTLKTFAAVEALSKNGFSQDTSTLVRSLLENLITVRYILMHPKTADQKAVRFVDYKWVIFKRYLPEASENPATIKDPLRRELFSQKDTIEKRIQEFKLKYRVISDKALVTWSGRALRDMARMAGHGLLEEYDTTFRLASRFTHPGIIGDREYVHYEDNALVFSPLPSGVGVEMSMRTALKFMLQFLAIFDEEFSLGSGKEIQTLQKDFEGLPVVHNSPPAEPAPDKEKIIVRFEVEK